MADRSASRHRESEGERRHKKKHSKSRHHDGERRSGRSNSRQALSMDALAALNDANVRGSTNSSSRDDEQEELERRQRQERRERRRRESRANIDRDEYREVETDSPRRHRYRRSETEDSPLGEAFRPVETTESPRRSRYRRSEIDSAPRRDDEYRALETDSPSRHRHRRSETRERDSPRTRTQHHRRESRSQPPAPPPAYESEDAGSDYHHEGRRHRKRDHRSSKAAAYADSSEAFRGIMTDERDRDDNERRERRRKEHKRKKVAAAAAAAAAAPAAIVVEEEKSKSSFWQHIRGGGTNTPTSYDSLYKDDEYYEEPPKKKFWTKKKIWIAAALSLVILLVIIIAAVVVSKKSSSTSSCTNHLKCNLESVSEDDYPSDAPDYLNPFDWYDTRDFNITYTDAMVGDLPIMGLNSTWDDSAAANDQVPALNQDWGSYATRPARGVNLGGWLSIEPFIAPELFNDYDEDLGIIDEWTLCEHLGSACGSTLEQHYSSFVDESTFAEIADAGLDHVRIPFSYWAVQTYDEDPYLFRTSWRYLLRGIEWARKYGLRINLDLHGLPGSQNGWNHSGHQGPIGWFNGTNGTLNVERSIDVHDRLSKFFAQDRYQNIISHYGLANEPRMTVISPTEVINWTETVYARVRANGLNNKTVVVFGDGFRGLDNWQGEMSGYGDGMALDVHQYVIFNNNQIVYNHTEKVNYACQGWTEQTEQSMNTSTGFGPTLIAEWSQADTDCATYLNNVGWGNRWTGTYDTGNASDPLRALTPRCPLEDDTCNCASANADPSSYSDDYKQFLLYFASAQMDSFETGWGWWYWTWWTGSGSTQWSYKRGLAAGILPKKAYDRSFRCDNTTVPDWYPSLPETY